MADTKKHGVLLPYLMTPVLLLLLTGGILLLIWSLLPSHQIQKYLSIAFMDNLKTSSVTDGLQIIEQQISTEYDGNETYEIGEIKFPTFGEQYAVLQAEAIDLSVPLYFGTNTELLSRGACQSTQSTVIGDIGNAVIDAHVNTFFAELGNLKIGDTVTAYTTYGKFTYEVTELLNFSKTDKKYLAKTETECMTLYTCKPQVLGSSDFRIGVRCEIKEKQFYKQAE